MYLASGSKFGLSTPLTSAEVAGGKLVLLIALHSSSLVLGKDGESLTGGQNRDREETGKSERKVPEKNGLLQPSWRRVRKVSGRYTRRFAHVSLWIYSRASDAKLALCT